MSAEILKEQTEELKNAVESVAFKTVKKRIIHREQPPVSSAIESSDGMIAGMPNFSFAEYKGEEPLEIVTRIPQDDGTLEEETRNTAKKGDFIISGAFGEQYVVRSAKMASQYDLRGKEGQREALPKQDEREVAVMDEQLMQHIPDGKITPTWGGEMQVKKGDWVVLERNPESGSLDGIYRIEGRSAAATHFSASAYKTVNTGFEIDPVEKKEDLQGFLSSKLAEYNKKPDKSSMKGLEVLPKHDSLSKENRTKD